MKLEINNKQLELLQFMVLHFECDDDEEEELNFTVRTKP